MSEQPPLVTAPPGGLVPTELAGVAPGSDLGDRAARGAGVTLSAQVARMVLQVVAIVVLAHLLNPRDYGLVAIVVVVIGVGEIFRDFGLTTAAIQARTLSREEQDNLFWVNAGIGVALSLLVFAAAGLLASAFGQPVVAPIARALAVTFTLNGLATQYRADLTRRLQFGRLAATEISCQVVGLGVAVALAAEGAGYWALVAQQLVQLALGLVLVAWFAHWLPRRPHRDVSLRPFLRVGFNLAATEVIYYLSNNLDTLTIGLRFSSASLGVYTRGFQLLMTPLNQLRAPATTVALPILSRLQDDMQRAGEYLRRAQLILGYTIVPALAVAAGASVPTVALLLGPQWSGVAPVLTLFAIAGACQTLAYIGFWVYLSRGLARELFRYTMVTLVLQAACIIVGSVWGIVGVAAGYAVAAVLEWPLSLSWLSRRTSIPLADLLHGAWRILACSVPMGLAAFGAARLLAGAPAVLGVLGALVAGAACLALASRVRTVHSDLAGVLGFGRRMMHR